MRRLVLSHHCSPGDIAVMTAAVRDLHLAYPGQYAVTVDTSCKDIWRHHPGVISQERVGAEHYKLCYGLSISELPTRPQHFIGAFHKNLERQLKIEVPLTDPKPDLHLTEEEKATRFVAEPYWLVIAGGKRDYTAKWWVHGRYQTVVNMMRAIGLRIVQAGARGHGLKGDWHLPLDGVLNMIGKTNLREFMRLVYHAEGVICPITAAMHFAAAFDKPCVVLAGGREQWYWEAYSSGNPALGSSASRVKVSHRFLHTTGMLPCCSAPKFGCWKNKATATEGDKSYCHYPERSETGQTVPKCQAMITPERVVEAVISYYLDGTLDPGNRVMVPAVDRPLSIITPTGHNLQLQATLALADEQVAARPLLLPPPIQLTSPAGNPAKAAAKKEKRDKRQPEPVPHGAPLPGKTILDDPAIGGRVTICVLMYGDYHPMHRRCLESVLTTTPADRIDLRVAGNQICRATKEYLQKLRDKGRIDALYLHDQNLKKYPVQREMWHDPDKPLTTRWVIWLDDDTMCDKRTDWLTDLAKAMIKQPDVGMFGAHRFYTVKPSQLEWMRGASWWKGRPLQDKGGHEVPNGNRVHFCVGAFFAVRTDVIKACDIPDVRLGNNGGDWLNGAALWQNGYKIKMYTGNKEIVNWSATPRRGLSEVHPGL